MDVARSLQDCVSLNNDVRMPWLGLGTWRTPAGEVAYRACRWALEVGYRHIDTAALYENEADVGRAVRDSGLKREEVFVTTKVWNTDLRLGRVQEAAEECLKRLGFDYVDLLLIHWPVPGRFLEAWEVFQKLYEQRKARAIGVSNFLEHHLAELLPRASVVPAVNQVEWHPWLRQPGLMSYCRSRGIQLTAWSPLMQGRVVEVPELVEIGKKHGKTPAQVAIRWGLQHQVIMIPKSVHRERIIENAQVFDFQLTPEEMARIDALDRNQRLGPDPNHFDF